MKIRTGFVSNSSSSSFCIYGVELNSPDEKLFISKEKMEKLKKEYMTEEDISKFDQDDFENYIDENGGFGEILFEDFDKLNLRFEDLCGNGDGTFYVGRSWASIKDDETGKQFKDRVKKDIEGLMNKKKKLEFDTYEESYAC